MDSVVARFPWKLLTYTVVSLIAFLAFAWILGKIAESDIIVATLGFAGAVIVASIQYRLAKNREAEARLFSEKQKVYADLIQTIMDTFQDVKKPNARQGANNISEKLIKIKPKMIIWGSFGTIASLDRMGDLKDSSGDTDTLVVGLERLGDLIDNIRRDLGHTNDPENAGKEIALGFVTHSERPAVRARIKASQQKLP